MKITLARADKISSVFNFWDACQCKLLTSNMISRAIWCKQETILFS